MLEIKNAILDTAIQSVLTDVPMSPKTIRDLVDASLSAQGYNTVMLTDTGKDNLYIKISDRLRKWAIKGVYCREVSKAKFVKLDSDQVISQSPVINEASNEPVINEASDEIVEQPIVKEQPKQTEPKQTKTKTKTTISTEITIKDEDIMNVIDEQKDMWIGRLKSEGASFSDTPKDLSCPSIRALAIATQSCYGTFLANDPECKICPLSKWCSESKTTKNSSPTVSAYVSNPTAEAKAKSEADAKAKAKAEAKASKPIVSQKLNDAVSAYGKQEVDLSCDIICVISQDQLKAGSKGYFVNTIGIVSPRCFA